MIRRIIRAGLGLVLLGVALSPAAPAIGSVETYATGAASQEYVSAVSLSASPMATTPSPSPSNPVDSGTGETKESKETRVDYAPYVIGAVVVIALIAAYLFYRRRPVSHPSKPG